MDEPLSNLDAQLRIQTRLELIQLHARLGITTMYVTHDQVEAMTMGHRIAVMSEGVLQQIGTPQDVYRRPANVFVATFLGAPPMNLIDGALESVDGGWRFRGRTSTCRSRRRCSSAPELEHEIEARGEVKLGLRPEHFRLGAPGQDGGIPGRVGSSSRSAPTSTSRSRRAARPSRCAPTPTRRSKPDDNVTLHFDALARARVRRRRAQPAPRRAASALGGARRSRRRVARGRARAAVVEAVAASQSGAAGPAARR